MKMISLYSEKLRQAAELISLSGADLWLTYVRETSAGSDPVLPLLIEGGLTWQSALLVSPSGQSIAIVGNYDADPLLHSEDWDEVIPYIQDIEPILLETLKRLLPNGGRIAVNYSEDDVMADGLTHGMYLNLQRMIEDRYELISAAPTVMALRGVKSPQEVERVREALIETQKMFDDIASFARIGVSERSVYDHVHALARERNLTFSWDPAGDPIVNSGPDSMIGHGIPSDRIMIQPGHIFHVDLGLTKNGYSGDIQRSWFVGDEIPEDVAATFRGVSGAIQAASQVLRPGVLGHQVDQVARQYIIQAGFPEYQHALGHQVGRKAHDGGAILGPQWPRYGNTPSIPIRAGEIYTLELGVTIPGRGYLGLEEMVLVTESGCEWLMPPQREVMIL